MSAAVDTEQARPVDAVSGAEGPSAQTTLTPRDAWSRSRVAIAVLLLLALVSVVIALSVGRVSAGYLNPEAADPSGGRAIAALLADRGVEVTRRVVPEAREDTTLFVAAPDLVDPSALADAIDDIGPTSDVVVVDAGRDLVRQLRDDLDLELRVAGSDDPDERRPACDADVAVAAGVARTGGFRYEAPDATFRCYASGGDATLVIYDRPAAGRVSFLGSGELLTNRRLDEDGNAALALGLLSRHPGVDWVYPRLDELGLEAQEQSLRDLFPERLRWAIVQVFIALLLLALWRGRRLGPIVSEALPVVVRAAEAVEGRARLYEGGDARDRAATVLRAAARDRLVQVLGLSREASRSAVSAAVAERTGAPAVDVELLLYGGPPANDAELVRLASALDSLERRVRTT